MDEMVGSTDADGSGVAVVPGAGEAVVLLLPPPEFEGFGVLVGLGVRVLPPPPGFEGFGVAVGFGVEVAGGTQVGCGAGVGSWGS